jgi:tryptophanyl-tRNA synthetase
MTGKLVKVPGLDGSGKMGKSEGEGNAIFLRDDEKTITNKLKKSCKGDTPTVQIKKRQKFKICLR